MISIITTNRIKKNLQFNIFGKDFKDMRKVIDICGDTSIFSNRLLLTIPELHLQIFIQIFQCEHTRISVFNEFPEVDTQIVKIIYSNINVIIKL